MTTATTTVMACRLAYPDEGPLVKDLIHRNAGAAWDWMDWSSISQNWLIAEYEGTPCGCIMFSPGVPVARVDMLSVDPTLPRKVRALAARDLAYDAWDRCARGGAQAVLMMIEWSTDNQWMTIAQHRGAVPYGEGVMLVKPVQRGMYAHRIHR